MSLRKHINRRVGQAMHMYDMLADGDKVIIGVSGGTDSLFLTWLLNDWRRKAPISYEILAVHVNMEFISGIAQLVEDRLRLLDVPFLVDKADVIGMQSAAKTNSISCFNCARTRRNRLFQLAREKQFSKIALGHHKDDIIETFFLNMLYSGNLSTMVPRQDLFDGGLTIIRPLAFLDKEDIKEMAARLGISPVDYSCPHEDHSKRNTVRTLLDSIFLSGPRAKASIFSSLSNLKPEYMLKNPKSS